MSTSTQQHKSHIMATVRELRHYEQLFQEYSDDMVKKLIAQEITTQYITPFLSGKDARYIAERFEKEGFKIQIVTKYERCIVRIFIPRVRL